MFYICHIYSGHSSVFISLQLVYQQNCSKWAVFVETWRVVTERERGWPERHLCVENGRKLYNSSDPTGDRVGPLAGVPEAILKQYHRIVGQATSQRPYTTAMMVHDSGKDWTCSVLTTTSDATEINRIVVVGAATPHWLLKITVASKQSRTVFAVCGSSYVFWYSRRNLYFAFIPSTVTLYPL